MTNKPEGVRSSSNCRKSSVTDRKSLDMAIGNRFEFLTDNFDKPETQDWDSWLTDIMELEGRPAAWDAGYIQGYLDALEIRVDDDAEMLGLPAENKKKGIENHDQA